MSSFTPRDSSLSRHTTALPPSSPSRRRRAIGVGREPTSPRVPTRGRGAYQVFGKCRRDCSLDVFFPLRPVFADLHRQSSSSSFAPTTHCKDVYPLFVVRFHILCVASTRSRELDSNRSASFDSYMCDTC